MNRKTILLLLVLLAVAASLRAEDVAAPVPATPVVEVPAPPPAATASPKVRISDVAIRGSIEGENILFELDFTAECEEPGQWAAFVVGDVALEKPPESVAGSRVSYESAQRRFVMHWPKKGTYRTSLAFAARPKLIEGGDWREAEFSLPSSRLRDLAVVCDRTDLEVRFPGALRVTRQEKDGKLTMAALLGPGLPFVVRWKPQVAELDAALVLAGEANTIVTVRAGALRLDGLHVFEIPQGKLRDLAFLLPEKLSVTQVRGPHIRDWRVEEQADGRRLRVALNRPMTKSYALQVVAELPLAAFPTRIEMPVLRPEGVIRAGGHLALGTDSAIHLVVEQTSGLSQTEPSGFPRLLLERDQARPLPAAKMFCYTYASTPYRMTLEMKDIVPSFDATGRHTIRLREEEMSVESELELDVRDAPLRSVAIEAPAAFAVAAVTGEEVSDYTVREGAEKTVQETVVQFRKPVLGPTLIRVRLELGRSPLDKEQRFAGLRVRDAKSERGFVVVAADPSVQVETPKAQNLREVHTGSVPMRAADAQFAYRYSEIGWSLAITSAKKASGLLAESFHLASLGEGALYGYVVVNYVVSGAPVDEFRFRIPKEIENVDFVGGDIRRSFREGDLCTVKLQRKVIGDYNLAVSYSHPWKAGEPVVVGGVECEDTERRSGFIVVSSHLNLRLEAGDAPDANLLEIKTEEIPPNYRLLLNAPILKAYKYVARPHRLPLRIATYEQGALLPVVVEVMELNSELNITDAGETESVTRIRYKVKNASNQFLALTLPERVTVWSTSLIERDASGRESAVRLTASVDAEGRLMRIPLRRLRDPNTPMTVEVVYGQEHPELHRGGSLSLTAPTTPVQTAFAMWTVRAPKDWVTLPTERGNMAPRDRRAEFRDLGDVVWTVLRSWGWAVSDGLPRRAPYVLGAVALILIALAFLFRRGVMWRVAVCALLLGLLVIGLRAACAPDFRAFTSPDDLRTAVYTRVLGLDDASGMNVTARVAPAWRRDATFVSAVIVPAVGLVLLVAGWRVRRMRPLLFVAGLVGLLVGAACFPAAAKVLAHILAWGLPAALLLGASTRLLLPVRRIEAVAAALLLMALATGCASLTPKPPLHDSTTVTHAAYTLTAEKDSVSVTARLRISTPSEAQIPLLPSGAILLSKEKISDDAEMVRHGGAYALRLKKPGVYDATVEFLCALPEAGENQVRRFQLAAPPALTTEAELRIPEKGIDVAAPTAVRFTREEVETGAVARALLGPGDAIEFLWRPRARERRLEETAFYVDALSLVRFDTGLARGRHRLRFQIAQGEIKDIRLRAPENVTVTAVEGEGVAAWRFNPDTHELEARLAQPVGGEYVLLVTTQIACEAMPAAVALKPLAVLGAAHQRGILGLSTSAEVFITPGPHGAPMNVDDFAREAAPLTGRGAPADPVRHAYRIRTLDDALSVEVAAVRPEIRSAETATFTVSDERMIYNGELRVSVAKAGVFSVEMALPEGYDIDALSAPEVSHWDETPLAGGRGVQIHFRNKLLGDSTLKVTLSRTVGELPEELAVPRIEVKDSLKHSGQISVTSSRNVRLAVKDRAGVSELNAPDLGIQTPGALAFALLRPAWTLTLKTEVVKPRINVEFLHYAEISDGLVRHTHYLRYRFYNAGQKVLEVQTPKHALGLEIIGPEIAHLKETEPGRWRVELARRQYDAPYILKLRFDTQFDRENGEIALEPSRALDVDRQSGHVVAHSTDRVELSEKSVSETLQPADARNLERTFGAGDLSGAAFCYSSVEPDYRVVFRATRHAAAALLEATVLETALNTVLSETGEAITHVHLRLRVGSKRHLEVRLPAGAQVWSLGVNLRSEVPSKRRTDAGDEALLIPLAQAVSGDLPVEVDLIYIVRPASGGAFADQVLRGPQFDLPLQNVRWCLYLPEHYKYSRFESTLNVNEDTLRRIVKEAYDLNAYEQRVAQVNVLNRKKALELQAEGNKLAQVGNPQEARQALSWANNYAFNDPELNEDTRVQLHSLIRQQAVVGLVDRRNYLRQKKGEAAQEDRSLGVAFDQAQAERVRNSLDRRDSDNLESIAVRLIETQEEASRSRVQLMVNVPLRGRVIELTRALQVKPNAEMTVSFAARREAPARLKRAWASGLGLALLLALCFVGDRRLAAWRADAARRAADAALRPAAPPPSPVAPVTPETDAEA